MARESGALRILSLSSSTTSLPRFFSDAGAFPIATALLTQPSRLLWLSPDNPPVFHQNEGVARTAHAKNSDLRLTTLHAASEALANKDSGSEHLVNVAASVISKLADRDSVHTEREYRIRGNGAVTIPRLHHSDRLGHALADGSDSGVLSPGIIVSQTSKDHFGFLQVTRQFM